MCYHILTPILLPRGFIDWVNPWRVPEGTPAYLYGEEFATPYCPIIIEVRDMTAFEQGYDAFLRGLKREENPFDAEKCSFSVKRWIDGWNKAYRARQEKQT